MRATQMTLAHFLNLIVMARFMRAIHVSPVQSGKTAMTKRERVCRTHLGGRIRGP
jgi:hypothetical protein